MQLIVGGGGVLRAAPADQEDADADRDEHEHPADDERDALPHFAAAVVAPRAGIVGRVSGLSVSRFACVARGVTGVQLLDALERERLEVGEALLPGRELLRRHR